MPPLERERETVRTEAEMIARAKAVRARLRGPVPARAVAAASPPPPRRAKLIELITSWKPPAALAAAVVLDGDPVPAPPPPPPRPTTAAIIKATAEYFHLDVTEMISDRRTDPLPYARHIAMYLATKLTTWSLPRIGRALNNRDHTTVLHGKNKIEGLIAAEDSQTVAAVNAIRRFVTTGEKDFPAAPPPVFQYRRKWRPEDEAELERMWLAETATAIIALALRRSSKAIRDHAGAMKLPRRSP